ncbi:MAG: phosphonate transport system substrate-binding protein [Candidatus Cloacimonadota bacterium]|jgi:phosphonate transport system substrate-binding protein|nr:phosphonate transport system substrate-binding protein [Candidatus Cloacimonadota bacterium]
MKIIKLIVILTFLLSVAACNTNAKLGSKHNPIKMYFVPSMEAGKIITSGREIADHLEEVTGYSFKVAVPTSYASVIEAMGTKETDIAWLATFAYVLAHEKFGAEVELTVVRQGMEKYRGQFVAKVGSGIDSIEDIEGKVIAYTDAASTSGYIYPSALLKQKGIKPARTFFAGGHPQAILAVYQGRADVGCTFWTPSNDNEIRDARRAVIETYPDVVEKIKIIGFTDWIPNDTVAFRKNFPKEMKEEIVDELLKFAKTKKGKRILYEILDIDDLVRAKDSDYDIVRETLKLTGSDAADMLE